VYAEVANVGVRVSVVYGVENEFQLLRGLKSECGQEVQVLCIEVWARLLEESELSLGYLYVFEL
jgi:hypothetical protein